MGKTSKEIVRDLLKQANYYWYDDNKDNVNPLNPEDYDPVVDKIFKANAVELEKLYAEIDESRHEIILGLSKTLVPNQSLLPEPGYTIAQVKPKVTRLEATPEDNFLITGLSDIGEQHEYYFSPLFEHNHPKCEVLAILTDDTAIQMDGNEAVIVKQLGNSKATSSIWLGLKIDGLKENHTIPFFLGNSIIDEFDKDYHVLHSSKWLIGGKPELELEVSAGIESFNRQFADEHLLDQLGVANSYEQQIYSRFKDSFILVAFPDKIQSNQSLLPPQADEELCASLDIKDPIYWIKIDLSIPISNKYLLDNILYPNCIPLVNRRLLSDFVVKSNYDRILLPMPTKDFFLDAHKVQDTRSIAEGTEYQRIDFLSPESKEGTYVLRSGSRVRRLNREDATKRIRRLIEIIQDEYSTFKEEGVNRLREDFDVIEKAINRIKSQLPDYFREEELKASYFCIANFRPGVNRIAYSYWETQGEAIKHLGERTGLAVSSTDVQIGESMTVIPIQKGKGELNADDYINQVKIALLSGGKIMTKGDIELYCKSRFGRLFKVKDISRKLMVVEDGKLGRGILVKVGLVKKLSPQTADYARIELQNDLNSKSAMFTQIKVEVDDGAGA